MSEEKKVFCTQCGSENSAGAKFCSNCGAKLETVAAAAEAVPVTEAAPVAEAAPVEEAVTARESAQPETENNVYAQGLPEENSAAAYEKVTDAEEIKPEPIQDEIQINYDNAQGDFSGSESAASTYSSTSVLYSSSAAEKPEGGGNIGVAIASLVCGILSLVCCCFSCFSLVLAIAALALGIVAIVKKYDGKGMAIAGIITAGIGIVIFIFFIVLNVAGPYEEMFEEILNEME